MFLQFIIIFVLAATLGSYINVLIYRRSFKSSASGRSRCTSCKKVLKAGELIPIFSYLIQNGKCTGCKQKISKRYIFIEILTILSTLIIFITLGFSFYSFLLMASLLFVIPLGFIDIIELEFPSFLLFPFVYFSFAYSVYLSVQTLSFLPLVAPFLFASAFYLLYVITKKRGIGFGDVILAFSLGGLIGFDIYKLALAFIGSFWIGTLIYLSIMVYQKYKKQKTFNRNTQVPFGPFIILSAFISILFL